MGLLHAFRSIKLVTSTDFPGGPVVKNPPSNAGDMGSNPDWEAKTPTYLQAAKPTHHQHTALEMPAEPHAPPSTTGPGVNPCGQPAPAAGDCSHSKHPRENCPSSLENLEKY